MLRHAGDAATRKIVKDLRRVKGNRSFTTSVAVMQMLLDGNNKLTRMTEEAHAAKKETRKRDR